jgi:predicted DNA-binding protein (MmcQ/YjbR family)
MEWKEILNYCLGKPGAEETFPFGPDVSVIKTGSLMFALISADEKSIRISLKCDPVEAESLRKTYAAVTPGYHMNKAHWNTVELDGSIPQQVLCAMIDASHEMVFKKLSRKEKSLILSLGIK